MLATKIQNPEARGQKKEAASKAPAAKNLEPEARNQMLETKTRSQKPEV